MITLCVLSRKFCRVLKNQNNNKNFGNVKSEHRYLKPKLLDDRPGCYARPLNLVFVYSTDSLDKTSGKAADRLEQSELLLLATEKRGLAGRRRCDQLRVQRLPVDRFRHRTGNGLLQRRHRRRRLVSGGGLSRGSNRFDRS